VIRLIFNLGLMLVIAGVIVFGYRIADKADEASDDFEQITIAELKTLLDNHADVVTVDVRSKNLYSYGHIPGAISMPYSDEIQSRYKELPTDKTLVVY